MVCMYVRDDPVVDQPGIPTTCLMDLVQYRMRAINRQLLTSVLKHEGGRRMLSARRATHSYNSDN
jgi:hypothetical protein